MTRFRAAFVLALAALVLVPLAGCGGADAPTDHKDGVGHDHSTHK